jgi:hypothetical protein
MDIVNKETFWKTETDWNRLSEKIKDIIRQKRIIDGIKPKMFIRYDQKNNRLYNTLTNISIL